MNRTIKEATVKRFHYDDHHQLEVHLQSFVDAYNFARRLKTLRGLTPYEFICKCWTNQPERFTLNLIHQMPGLNILERLTKPADGSEAYDCGSEDAEGAVEVSVTFVADGEAPELIDPGEGPLDHPSVLAEMLGAVDAPPGDAGRDAPLAQVLAAAVEVVALVGVELFWPLAGTATPLANRVERIDHRGQRHAVVPVGPGQDDGERQALSVDHDVPLGARLAAISRVRADRVAPLFAGTEEASTLARDQSISPERLRRSSMWRWISSHTPASCQARSRRQQVMPEHPATSNGNRSHGIAV